MLDKSSIHRDNVGSENGDSDYNFNGWTVK